MNARPNPAKAISHLFVYGTLLPGKTPPAIRPTVKLLHPMGPAMLDRARLYDLREFPAAVPAEAGTTVRGRVYRLPPNSESLLRELDAYEEAQVAPPNPLSRSLFVRRPRKVYLKDGRSVRAWVYFYNRPTRRAAPIARGRYDRRPANA